MWVSNAYRHVQIGFMYGDAGYMDTGVTSAL